MSTTAFRIYEQDGHISVHRLDIFDGVTGKWSVPIPDAVIGQGGVNSITVDSDEYTVTITAKEKE